MRHGKIIYLNGPSSVGKSSLAKDLQTALNEPYLHIGIDRLIGMMPEKINDWSGEEPKNPLQGFSWQTAEDENGVPIKMLSVGPYAQTMGSLLRELVRTMIREGHHVIVDDVSFGKGEVEKWLDALKGEKAVWVGLSAPVEVLELREKARGNRAFGSARAQAPLVHRDVDYDLTFDTSQSTNEEIVKEIIKLLTERGWSQ